MLKRATGNAMLMMFAKRNICIVVGDLLFVNPIQRLGEEGMESGFRLEIRHAGCYDKEDSSAYAGSIIEIKEPLWRADVLCSEKGRLLGVFDRAHYHASFDRGVPGERIYSDELMATPIEFLAKVLGDVQHAAPMGAMFEADLDDDDAEAIAELSKVALKEINSFIDAVRLRKPWEDEVAESNGRAGVRMSWL